MRTTAFLPLFAAFGSYAATFHVAPTGNDANIGLSLATAFATLQHGADVALAGDTVLVEPGDYQGFAAMNNSGTSNAPIVFIGAGPGVSITSPCSYNDLDGINVEGVNWVVVEGFTVNDMPRTGIRTVLSDQVTIRHNSCHSNYKWGILTGFAEHVVIEYNSCSGSEDEHGIYFGNSADDPIIRFNHVFDNNANGIHMNGDESQGGDGIISNAQVYGNVIHDNGVAGGSGINCDGVVNSVFYNNLLYGNHASGISLYRIDGGGPSTGNRVYNNTIINADDARWCVNITDGCTGDQVLNNILINLHPFRGSIVVAADALDGFVSDYNLVVERLSPDGDATILDMAGWQALGYDAHSQVADAQSALFMGYQSGDFHPLSAAAQMVDAGTNAVNAVVIDDLDGTARPQGATYDIGCFEGDFNTAAQPSMSGNILLVVQGHTLMLRGGARVGSIEWLDGTGRRIAPGTRISSGCGVPVPPVPWCIAVLRDASGSVTAVRRVVVPQ